jgi:hypothetical protein
MQTKQALIQTDLTKQDLKGIRPRFSDPTKKGLNRKDPSESDQKLHGCEHILFQNYFFL